MKKAKTGTFVVLSFLALAIFLSMGSCSVDQNIPDDPDDWYVGNNSNEGSSNGNQNNTGNSSNSNQNDDIVETEAPKPSADLQYEENGSGYVVTGIKGNSHTEIVVPDTYKGKPVTAIQKGAFENCTNLKSLSVPFIGESVNSINSHFGYIFGASYDWENEKYVPRSLETVSITNHTSIGPNGFIGCSSIKNLLISNNTKYVAYGAFKGLVLEEITVPFLGFRDKDGYLNEYKGGYLIHMFIENSYSEDPNEYEEKNATREKIRQNLKKVTVTGPDVFLIEGLFSGFSALESVTIHGAYSEIGESAFCNCSSLKNFTISDHVTTIGAQAFENCKSLTSINIPGRVETIGKEAFSGCESLTEIDIPGSVKKIESQAFDNCTSLASVHLPDSIEEFGSSLFSNCSALTDVANISASESTLMRAFESSSFAGMCFTHVTIPATIQSIPTYAFGGCKQLTHVTIEGSLDEIGTRAFAYCTQLSEVEIRGSVRIVGLEAFIDCSSLVDFPMNKVQEFIDEGAFMRSNIASIDCRNDIGIGKRAFADCQNLSNISVSQNIGIGEEAFRGCTNLSSFTWYAGEGRTTISHRAFMGCTGLTEFTIPRCIGNIYFGAFSGCTNLTSVVFEEPEEWSVVNRNGKRTFLILSDPRSNAQRLTSTYCEEYQWSRSK